MNLLTTIKLALRIVVNDFDSEIQNYIDACKIDMGRVGITNIVETDAMIIRLIELYCKGAFNFENDGERYHKAYCFMRDGISLCDDYNGGSSNV